MTSLIADYEQQYSVLTAEITAEIGKLSRLQIVGKVLSSIISISIFLSIRFNMDHLMM